MRELVAQIPDVDAFLALAPEELAAKILFLLRQRRQEMFIAGSLETELWGGFGGAPGPSYRHTGKVTFIWPSPRHGLGWKLRVS
jgi:hypothetical protein